MVYEFLETSVIIDTNMNSSQPNADPLTLFLFAKYLERGRFGKLYIVCPLLTSSS